MALFDFFSLLLKKKNHIAVEKVLFGLGNPGTRYNGTRHNIGVQIIEEYIKRIVSLKHVKMEKADVLIGRVGQKTIAAVKSLTYVNCSGEAFVSVLKKLKCLQQSSLVIVDDFNLPIGRIRFRRTGSDGGHNGLKSIIKYVGNDFPRLRVGIGPKPDNCSTVDFVLGRFSVEERTTIAGLIPQICEAVELYIERGIEAVMNKYNS